MCEFAERLVALESGATPFKAAQAPASFMVCEKLRPQLSTLMGNAGFRALLSRALSLANAEVPSLGGIRVKPDGSLEGVGEIAAKIGPEEIAQSGVVLVAQLLGLLVAFIGENLTMHLVREVWPKLPLDDLHFGNRGKNEKTK
jgi:hypothetical protein